eukprot:EG_transcript_31800
MGKKGVHLNSAVRTEALTSAADWTVIGPGVNYLGFCRLAGCPVRGKSVSCQRGLGSHVVNDDISSDMVRCPKCGAPFEVVEIALYRCRARVVSHAQPPVEDHYEAAGSDVIKLGSDGKATGGAGGSPTGCLVEIITKKLDSERCAIS